MSVTGNFFCKLRSFAITLEKETAHLEQAFNQEDSEYEDESPMRVLHDLRSEIIGLKTDIQDTIAKNRVKGDELNSFLKICRVLQTRSSSDIHQIKDTFQKYGYNPPDNNTSENEVFCDNPKPDVADESNHNTVSADLPPAHPAMDKLDVFDLRAPQLSDFGLSHYQLPVVWEPQNKLHVKIPEEKPKPSYKDIRTLNVAKTPKCCLTSEEDFSQIEHFGISDYSNNLNDDYTIALINKKKGSATGNPAKENSHNMKSMLATPAHLKYRNDFCTTDSPLPPVFCTPGLKVHKKTTEKETCDSNQPENKSGGSDSSEENDFSKAVQPFQALSRDIDNVSSPRPPTFCTPGLKVQKKEMSSVVDKPEEDKDKEANVAKSLDTPPIPNFEMKWMKSDTLERTLDITELIPRPEMSHTAYLDQTAPLQMNNDQYGNPATKSPPKMSDFTIGTPPRPEMTSCLTQDVFKYSIKTASPPKVSEYENLLWTPTRPEMTSCITEDISQLLSKYCDNRTKPSWQNPQGLYTRNAETENKENRP